MGIFISYEDIKMKLPEGSKSLTESQLRFIKEILDRFSIRHRIQLIDYIRTIKKVGFAIDDGFDFTSDNTFALQEAIMNTKMFIDDSQSLVGKLASSQTDGLSLRELGGSKDKSLHCAIGLFKCSVHLDETLFTPKGQDGIGCYNPDLFQHVGYDLGYRYHVVRRFINVPVLGWTLNHLHPAFPHSSNGYKNLGLTFQVPLWGGVNLNASIKTKVDYKVPTTNNDFILSPSNFIGLSGYKVDFGLKGHF